MRSLFKVALLTTALHPSVFFAATQGTLGATSTGTVAVSITIPSLVQISGLSDIALGSTTTYPATGNTTACIYSNVTSPAGAYYVTASSANASSGNFQVKDSGSDVITYNAYWNNAAAAAQTTILASGTKTAQQTGGSSTSTSCGGTPNANFNVSFSATQVQAAPPGSYTDTVTLLITPT